MSTAECTELLSCFIECDALLRGYVRRKVPSGTDTEDLVQDVYVRLARMSSLSGIRDRQAFVIHAAKNLLRDRSRRARKRAQYHEEPGAHATQLPEVPDFSTDPSLVFESLETLNEAARVLDSLKDGTRRAFLRYRVDEWSHKDIATEIGVSISMVEKHVRMANSALRSAGIRTS